MPSDERAIRTMKLRDLHTLAVVVQAGSMNKAAALLNATQPAVSRSIGDLEGFLGVALLDRSPRGVAPTEYGRALLEGGTAVFDDLRQAVRRIEFLKDPAAGEVRIGSIIPLAASLVAAVIDRVSPRFPRIVFHIATLAQDALYRELGERKVDLLVAWPRRPIADERLAFEFLYDDSYVIVCGPKNPLVRRRKIELADLVNEPWVLQPPDSVLGPMFIDAFRSCGLNYPRATVIAMPGEVRSRLLESGRFLTIAPASALRFSGDRLKLKVLPIQLPPARLPIGIVTLKNRTLSPVAQLFIEHAREVAKPQAMRKSKVP
jgi:DNA-binding transcriptional LysR family regulator